MFKISDPVGNTSTLTKYIHSVEFHPDSDFVYQNDLENAGWSINWNIDNGMLLIYTFGASMIVSQYGLTMIRITLRSTRVPNYPYNDGKEGILYQDFPPIEDNDGVLQSQLLEIKAEAIVNGSNSILNNTFLPGELSRVAPGQLGYHNTGDFDNDGFITIADVGIDVDIILMGSDEYDSEAEDRGDVTNDGQLNVQDIIGIISNVLTGAVVEGNPPPNTNDDEGSGE